jgi:hypothetical protein
LVLSAARFATRAWHGVVGAVTASVIGAAAAPSVSAQATSVDFVVRPSALSDSAIAVILRELVARADSSRWIAVTVDSGQSLSGIVYEHFRVGDTFRKAAGRVLQDAVAEFNRLPEDRLLKRGQRLFLPPVPQFPERPALGAEVTGQQTWDKSGAGMRGVGGIVSELPRRGSLQNIGREIHTAPEWRISLPYARGDSAFQRFQNRLAAVQSSVFVNMREAGDVLAPATVPTEIDLGSDSTWESRPDPAQVIERAIDPAPGVTLFLLDFFQNRCGHGDQVRQVAEESLRRMGLARLVSDGRIITIDLDLRFDTLGKRKIVSRWLATDGAKWSKYQRDDWEKAYNRSVVAASTASDRVVSMLYYQAVMDSVRRTGGRKVVSSSFQVVAEGMGPFRTLEFPETTIEFYFSASGNDEQALETLGDWDRRQPQNTYFATAERFPLYLVAGELPSGRRAGNWSDDAKWGVPFVGLAGGWGGRGTCVNPGKYATSYSSPALAAMLFGALHVWQDQGLKLNHRRPVLTRLIAAAAPNDRLIDRHAVPGHPDSRKLLLGRGTYVRAGDGTHHTFPTPVVTGTIDIRLGNQTTTFAFPAKTGDDVLWSLAFRNDKMFFASSRLNEWARGTVTRVNLVVPSGLPSCPVTEGASCTITSPEALRSVLTDLVIVP